MKPTRINPRYLFTLLAIGLMILLLSCNLGSLNLPSGGSTSNSTSQSNGLTQTGGVLNMPDPAAGLSALQSYHLSYTSTIKGLQKGQDYESNLTIDEDVVEADRSELVQQTSTGSQPVYLAMVVLNGAGYTQQEAGGACRAATSAEALTSGLTWQLPPVFGAKQVGQETVNNISATHYQFDEKSVQWQAGQNGKAQGDVWIAQPGGYVLKYQLTIQLPSGDFQGTRTWSYELSDINSVAEISLPKGCLALINDIPVMEGASGVVQLPGFQRYVSSASLEQITQFYKDKLTAAGWSLLPGVEPQGGKSTLEYVQTQKDDRGRFAVIQLDEENGQTMVVVQSAYTKKPIVMDSTTGSRAAPATESPVETPAAGSQTETPAASASLPTDLPQYPGATVTVKTDSMVVLMTTDSPDKVNAFYSQAMAQVGYTPANSLPATGISTQTWTKDQLQIVVAVMQQGSSTQIVLSAQQK
jgi:hypothetical protein